MGGRIEVRSQPEQPGETGGSTFAFTIPLDEVSASDLERPPVTRRVVGVAAGQPELRMLVVDDKEVNRKLLVKLFAPLGFALREAADGQQAIEAWQAWQPHLIWMDMRMPVMDGYEATRRIKASTSGMATIIVALTASALEEDRMVILSEGCDDYLRKPFHEQELYDMVAKHLGVQFIYEELPPGAEDLETGRPAGAASSADVDAALVDGLSQIEVGWLDGLERAALLGDLDALTAEIGRLAELDTALAASLADLAARFDHERILALIAAARQEKSTSPQESDGNDSK